MFVPFANVNKTAYVIKYFYETEQKHFVTATTKYINLCTYFSTIIRMLRLYEIFNILFINENVLKLQHVTGIFASLPLESVHFLLCIISIKICVISHFANMIM